jgi:hypothetical protein
MCRTKLKERKKEKRARFWEEGGLWTVEEGAGQRQAKPTTQRPWPYPRNTLRDLFKTPASHAPCARGGLQTSLLFTVATAGGLSYGPSAVAKKCCHLRDGCSLCLSALSAPPLQNCLEAKSGHARRTPQTRSFGLLLSLLCALNDAKMCASALLTRLDVPFNLVSDGVP